MKHLKIVEDLPLPLDLATCVTLIAGKRGSGKTNTAKRVVEQVLKAGVPVCIIDPADVWWGLKASKDGKAEGGFPVYVFGGRHADLPLEATAGRIVADVCVKQRVSVVLSIRDFSGGERARFIVDLAERLMQTNQEPLLVVAEEAHEILPQNAYPEEKRALGAMLRLVRLGRSSGLGLLEVTQRLAALNKTATTQADVVVAHRTVGPQDRDALMEWVKHHKSGERTSEFLEKLPELKTGQAWLWAPDVPEEKPIGLKLVHVLECETFDSHATPKVGSVRKEPTTLAPVDLERLRAEMASTVERQKENDPGELRRALAVERKKGAELESRLAKASLASKPAPAQEQHRMLPKEERQAILSAAGAVEKLRLSLEGVKAGLGVTARLVSAVEELREDVRALAARIAPAMAAVSEKPRVAIESTTRAQPNVLYQARLARPAAAPTNGAVSPVQQKMLNGLAELEAIGYRPVDRTQIAFYCGYTNVRSGGFSEPIGGLISEGYLATPGIGMVELTEAGHRQAAPRPAPLSSMEIHSRIFELLDGPEQKMLGIAIERYPSEVSRVEIAKALGYGNIRSGGFSEPLGHLVTMKALTTPRPGFVKASDKLFLA